MAFIRKFKLGAAIFALALAIPALAATVDYIVQGSSPTAAGQPLCATGSGTAAFESAASCWNSFYLGPGSATQEIGWAGWPTTGALRYIFGDDANGIQSGNGDRVQLWAYHGITLAGGRATTSPPTLVTGSGASDASLTVIGNGTSTALVVQGGMQIGSTSANGTLISASYRGTTTSPSAVPAQVCSNTAITVTGAATGAECAVGLPSTFAVGLVATCFVSATSSVQLHICNPTTASITPTTGIYSVRVFNP